MSNNVVIYHNPRCSKSRAAVKLLEENGIAFREVLYLESALSACEIEGLANALGLQPLQFMRTKEKLFRELGLSRDDVREPSEWFQIMADNPILMERPIVLKGDTARIGRPTEKILEVL
jgi:arsenate reductase (glutaredoxin)